MACYHPLKAFPVGKTEAGKDKYHVTSYLVDHLDIMPSGTILPSCVSDRSSLAEKVVRNYIEIPCGKCVGCRLAYSRAWADRCLLELKDHNSSYFVTLTYDDDHVPISYYGDPDSGEAIPTMTLCKRDLQLFHKRLRKALFGSSEGNIRYFACGEYGDQTLRPHYHDIIFGLELSDLVPYSRSELGYTYYTSEFLSNLWSKGFVVVGEVTWDTCAYTARYVMKKLKGDLADTYDYFNIEAPFTVMSRKPGIARNYYDSHPELFDKKCIYLSTEKGSHPVYPSRYYKQLFDIDFPEKSAIMKERNKELAITQAQNKLHQTDLDYLSYLGVEESATEARIKSLRRKEF